MQTPYSSVQQGSSGGAASPQDDSPQRYSDNREPNDFGDDDNEQDREHASLLHSPEVSHAGDPASDYYGGTRQTPAGAPSVLAITLGASLLVLLLELIAYMPTASRLSIFTEIICRKHYGASWPPPADGWGCMASEVQDELELVTGWKATFDLIPGLIVSVPYGALAYRIGRGRVLLLALVGCVLSDVWIALVCYFHLPIRTIWLSSVFQLIGGGGATVVFLCYAVVGNACPPEKRTTAFSVIQAAILLSGLISLPFRAGLVDVNPWILILGAIEVAVATTVATFFVTVKYGKYIDAHMHDDDDDDDDEEPPSADDAPLSLPTTPPNTAWNRWSQDVGRAVAGVAPWLNRRVVLMLVAFFIIHLWRQAAFVLVMYTAFRFNLHWASAAYTIPLGVGINILLLLVLLPGLRHVFVSRRGFRASQSDKFITMLSGACLVIGSLFFFSARRPNPEVLVTGHVFAALGAAFTVTARSFLSAMAAQRHLTMLFASVAAVSSGGLIVGEPIMAAAYELGNSLPDFWFGMPFLLTAVLLGVATLAVAASQSRY